MHFMIFRWRFIYPAIYTKIVKSFLEGSLLFEAG